MMISISTLAPNIYNNIILQQSVDSVLKSNSARITNIPTLDGGSVAINSGVTETDKPIVIRGKVSKNEEKILWQLFETGNFLLMTSEVDFYLIALKKLSTDAGKLNITIMILNKEN